MKYLIFTIAILILSANATLSYTLTTYNPPMEVTKSGYMSYPKISQIKNILFNKTYENEDIEERLKRLEKKTCSRIYSGSDLSWRVDNIMANMDQGLLYNIPTKELSNIEKKILGKSYTKDKLDNRLARLEYQMLGAAQSGKPDERYQTILSASNHYTNMGLNNNPFGNTTIATTQNSGGFKGMLQNVFGSMFNSGYVTTGYTPPIAPYGYTQPYGFNPGYTPYGRTFNHYSPYGYDLGYGNGGITRSIRTRTGYYNSYRTGNSGCGVRILD